MSKTSPTYSTWEGSDDGYFSAHREDSKSEEGSSEKECTEQDCVLASLQPSASQSPWPRSTIESCAGDSQAAAPASSIPASELGVLSRKSLTGSKSVRFTTIRCTFQLNQPVNLALLAANVPGGNCIYDRNGSLCLDGLRTKKRQVMPNLARLTVRMKGRKVDKRSRVVGVTVFCNGAVGVIGAKTYNEVLRVSRLVLKRVRQTERREDCRNLTAVPHPHLLALADIPHADENGIRSDMARMDFDLGVGFKLDQAYRALATKFPACYEPDFFAGLRVKPKESITVVLYATGRGYVSGFDVEKCKAWLDSPDNELQECFRAVCGVLWSNLKAVANLSHYARIKPCKS